MKIKPYYLLFLLLILVKVSSAQTGISSDSLFHEARDAAFKQKDYPKAISLSKTALIKSPDYMDIHVFLGRIYTWQNKNDSARTQFTYVLGKQPGNADASMAYGSLEYWNNNSAKALQIVNDGLKYSPQNTDLLLLKGKILNDLRRFVEARHDLDTLMKIDPKNGDARSLADRVKINAAKNVVGISYDYIPSDAEFSAPWQLVSVEYGRQTGIGSFDGFINYANRFNSNGVQYELDAYPSLAKNFYAYTSVAYSPNEGIFPTTRAGFSLYAVLPAGFEAEGGFRYLHFSSDTWIYTAALVKYYKNFYFNLRTYLVPSYSSVSQSYTASVRYYNGGTDDYFSFSIGTGVSPDSPQNIILYNNGNNNYKLNSDNISAGYRHVFKGYNVVYISLSLDDQQYKFQTRAAQFDLGIGYLKRF